jgi:hypothetical protein
VNGCFGGSAERFSRLPLTDYRSLNIRRWNERSLALDAKEDQDLTKPQKNRDKQTQD